MIGLECVSVSARPTPRGGPFARNVGLLALGFMLAMTSAGAAETKTPKTTAADKSQHRSSILEASTSEASRRSAVASIPFEKLDDQARAKVQAVLSNISVYRRMPVRVVDCDPDLYLFLVRHPDVVVNIWEVLKLSKMKLSELDANRFQVTEPNSTSVTLEFLYQSHDIHLVYAEGTYNGPLLSQPVKGSCLMVLRTGYVRETDGRHYVTTRLDSFLNVEHMGAELLAKLFQPLTGKIADANFCQTVAFAGSLSRTAELNSSGVRRLAGRLEHVQPAVRKRFAELADLVAQRSSRYSLRRRSATSQVVSLSAKAERR